MVYQHKEIIDINFGIQRLFSIKGCCVASIGTHMLNIRQSRECLILMGIPIPGGDGLYIETVPRGIYDVSQCYRMSSLPNK